MHILILGGGVFLGAAILRNALERGHELTVFNRGKAQSAWPEGVQAIVGDRAGDLSALAGKRFDAVIDTCGYAPADVKKSAEALRDVKTYCFVSSISAYASFTPSADPRDRPARRFLEDRSRPTATSPTTGRRRRPARPRCRRCSASTR